MAQSNDPGYFHRSIDNGKNPPIRPFEPWTSNKKEAMVLAQELANENGYPITVYWSGIMDGTLSKVGRVKPKAGNQGKRGNPTPTTKLKQLQQELKEHKAWMKSEGIKVTSPFNGGSDSEIFAVQNHLHPFRFHQGLSTAYLVTHFKQLN